MVRPMLCLPLLCDGDDGDTGLEPEFSGAWVAVFGPMVAATAVAGPLWCSVPSTSRVPAPSSTAAAAATHAATVRACAPYTRRGEATGLGKPDLSNGSARPATRSRCPAATGEMSSTSRSTCSRRPAGSATIGSMLSSIAGLSSCRLRSPHTAQRSMCRFTRLRSRMVSSPSQPARMPSSSSHCSRPVRATSSAPSDPSNWARARDTSACALLRDTPRASARSSPSRTWRRFSSMTSRSPGFSPESASTTRSRSSSRSGPSTILVSSEVTSTAASRGAERPRARRRRKHSLRATAYSHGRSRSGSRSPSSLAAAMT